MKEKEKIALLRKEMNKNNIDVFIVYSADPHSSEYLPEEWQERNWISGFTGSAGFVVILKEKAGLWTDGRYYTQAETQLKDTGIDLFKDGLDETPNYIDWIISETQINAKIGVNALATTHENWEKLSEQLSKNNREIVNIPLIDTIWNEREKPSENEIFVRSLEKSGESVQSKIDRIRAKMNESGATVHLISTLDDVAWTLNLRGSDVKCNPVFLSYLYISKNETALFVDAKKLNKEAQQLMSDNKVTVLAYERVFEYLQSVQNESVLLAPNCNQSVFDHLKEKNKIIVGAAPSSLMKAIKNDVELAGFRTAMVKDGVAMVNFLYWFTQNVGKEPMNEYSIGEKLEGFRSKQENFVGISFDSIIGYKGNGAIIHYKAPNKNSSEVSNDGSILIDSGGQYLEGTTDITRTLPLGNVSDDFKRDYTLVLKGHIKLAMAKFPKGTRGVQLDTLARLPLWEEGKDYNHGTGHGVGSFMNVHEGPQSIRKDLNPQTLLPGMVLSNEPGYYVVDKYGIRLENLVAVKEWKKTEWNTFYEFENLTFCPFFKEPILKELLSKDEIQWLNDYHKTCEKKLSPYLEGEIKDWFLKQTAQI